MPGPDGADQALICDNTQTEWSWLQDLELLKRLQGAGSAAGSGLGAGGAIGPSPSVSGMGRSLGAVASPYRLGSQGAEDAQDHISENKSQSKEMF